MNNAELLNSAGSKLSEMDAYLARATERMAVQDYGSAQRNVSAAHVLLGDAGKALGEVAKAVLGGGLAKPTGLKPGQTVGDVGGNGGGNISGSPLTPQQMQALFTGLDLGQTAAFDASTPAMGQDERNQWIRKYGPGGTDHGEFLTWYGGGKQYAGS